MDLKKHLTKKNVIILLIAVGIILYINTLNNALFWDDDDFILNNAYIKDWSHFFKYFTQNIIAGSGLVSNYWRPVLLTVFSIQWHLWKDWNVGYHFTNMSFHIADSILIYFLLKKIFKKRLLPLFVSLIFLAHPLQTEAVAYANSLGDSLSVFFMLVGLNFYVRKDKKNNTLISLVMYIFALMSKETAIIMPALVYIVDYYSNYKKISKDNLIESLKRTYKFFVIAIIYVLLRGTILNFKNTFNLYNEENIFSTNIVVRTLTFFRIITIYFSLIFYPTNLHMERSVEVATSLFNWDVLLGFFITLGLITSAIFYFKKNKKYSLGVFWFFIALVPTSNILIPINGLLYEHWLYVPIIGFSIALFSLLIPLAKKFKKIKYLIIAFATYICFLGFLTIKRNNEWEDPIYFYKQVLEYSPNSYRIINNLGKEYAETGDFENAIKYYNRAYEVDSDNPVALHNLANAYVNLGDIERAEEHYKKALEVDPGFVYSYQFLAKLYLDQGEYKEALKVLEKYQNTAGRDLNTLIIMSNIAYENEDFDRSLYYLEQAQKLAPTNIQIQNQIFKVQQEAEGM